MWPEDRQAIVDIICSKEVVMEHRQKGDTSWAVDYIEETSMVTETQSNKHLIRVQGIPAIDCWYL